MEENQGTKEITNQTKLSLREKIAYGLGDTGYNFMFDLGMIYLMKFYTDVLGLPLKVAGLVFLLTKFIDAIFDIFIGTVADNRRKIGPKGKFRPFILYASAPLMITSVAVFITPDFTVNGRIIWAYATYIIFTTIYSVSNIPYGSMMPSMTKDPQERSQLSSFRIAGQNLGLFITNIAFIPIVLLFSDISTGYIVGATVFAVLGVGLNLYMYANVKERYIYVKPKEEKVSLFKSYGQIFKNSPLLILSLLNLFMWSAYNMKLTVQVYFCQYNLGDISIVPFLGFFQVGSVFIAIPLVPMLVKKIGKKGTYMLGALIWAAADICAYLFANNAVIFIACASLAFFSNAFINSLNWLMITDCVEYGEWKTGMRGEGIVYSFYTFCRKLAQALAGFIPGMILAFVGYVPNVEQTVRSLSGIRFMMFVYPAVLAIVSIVIMYFFYILNEKKTAQVFSELKERHQH